MADAWKDVAQLKAELAGCVAFDAAGVRVTDERAFVDKKLDSLVRTAVFGADAATRDAARWTIRAASNALGAVSASIQGLYDAAAAGKAKGFTVPAHNLRGLIYDKARAIFRAAKSLDSGAFIFEIAKSEMGYCDVRPAEYAPCVLAAAMREGWRGPVFIQGDHFQFAMKDYQKDPVATTEGIKKLTKEAIEAGFFNIDIDSSTLVVLERPTVKEQQRDNYERCAELTALIRKLEPAGVTISVGGEIGEVGKKNSTVEEFEAYFEGYREKWDGKPISKMSVQTGTSHGGVILPDGSRQEVSIDFNVLKEITVACRRNGLAGTVQHGASTLPERLFDQFPRHDAVEIHLATEFQRMVFDHPQFPAELREKMHRWIRDTKPPEWKDGASEAQNIEKCIKRAWGPHKREIWSLPSDALAAILGSLENKFRTLMTLLNSKGTRSVVRDFVKLVPVNGPKPAGL
ncbi:MAG TPA: class II fructose-bisphosphate aldolase [Planctomycetota bacterium]|nr:class II fructose-bisphosphate aldolase [Planctomycetota bacterium]